MPTATTGPKWIVVRDDNGLPTQKIERLAQKQTLRALIRAITSDGAELIARMDRISRGVPFTVTLADGRVLDPIVPTIEAQLDATKYLLDRLGGKAVAETEVAKAEEQSQELEAIRALSSEELEAEGRRLLMLKGGSDE